MILDVMLDKDAYAPERAYKADAGLDLRSPIFIKVKAGGAAVIDTGVHVDIPQGFVGMLKSKSGLNVKYSLQSEGVIDAGYTGSIVVKLYNHGKQDLMIEQGDKISQLVILPTPDVKIHVVNKLQGGERGNNGFGSTGR